MQNARRDLLRQFLKNTTMPQVYWAEIPMWDEASDCCKDTWFPFLLPHEVFARLLQSDSSTHPLLHFLSPEMSKMRDKLCTNLGIAPEELIGVGLFGDGVPHAKRKVVECWSWNFVAQPDSARILAACMEKSFCCQCGCSGRHTTYKVLEVLCWSFRCMLMGKFPQRRHDGTHWLRSDDYRSALKGSLGSKGGLMQIRGDWALCI